MRRLLDRIRDAHASKTPLDIQGGRTKRFYGGVPRGVALDLSELSGITSYEPTELVITALAGTPLAEIESLLASRRQCLPFEPPRFGAAGTVGGMVAAGLSGPARSSVGGLRDHVLGVSVLSGTGESLTFGGQVMKNVAGYDVSRLFAGSMGILGVICEVSLKVMPMPSACSTFRLDIDAGDALALLNRWAGQPVPLRASAWHRGTLTVRLAGAKAAVAAQGALWQERGREVDADDAAVWWDDVRDQRHAFFRLSTTEFEAGHSLWRLSVPDTTAPLQLPGEQFIEWGGAQRWLRGLVSAAEVRAAAAAAGGHATLVRALDKSAGVFTAPSATSMNIHRRLKQSFDPAGIFNPGRLYAEL